MARPAVWAAVLGVCCGVVGGALGGWLVARDPGRGRGALGTLRGDVDGAEADGLAARANAAAALAALETRLDVLERRVAAAGPGASPEDVAALAKALSDDVRALREAVARDLAAADARLGDLEHRVAQFAALTPPAPGAGPTPEEEEPLWLNLARDADPLRRFSALKMLGRVRTDRSVRASVEALEDPAPHVVWQAAQNLGRFDEKSAARDLAAILRHDDASVRAAVYEALRRLGAPDVGFDAAAVPEKRRAAVEALDRWAAEIQ